MKTAGGGLKKRYGAKIEQVTDREKTALQGVAQFVCPQDITEITSRKRLTGHVACVGSKADSASGYPEGLVISSLPPGKYRGSNYRQATKLPTQ